MTPRAISTAKKIIDSLKGRRGIGDELEQIDDDIMDEIIEEVAQIIYEDSPEG